MMYGNRDLSFFGKLLSGLSEPLIPVLWLKKQKPLRLEAGLVHGVDVDDEYELLSFDVAESSLGSGISIPLKANVFTLQNFTPDMVKSEADFFSAQSEERWKAKALTHIFSKRINVQVMMEEHQANELIRLAKNAKFLSLFPKLRPALHVHCFLQRWSIQDSRLFATTNSRLTRHHRKPKWSAG